MKSVLENDPDGVQRKRLGFLLNGGTVGALLQDMEWSQSPLGPPQEWSPSLKTIMATFLPAQAQIVLFWGEQFVALYNDAYAPTIGAKHPRALGRPAMENWLELWDDLGPLLQGVRDTGETFSAKDRPFYIERGGLGETAYFDVSYSAVREASGEVGGVLCIVTETTERVRFQRRQSFLLELGQTLPTLGEPEAIEAYAVRKLGEELGASRVFFGEDNGDGASFQVAHDWVDDVPSVVGRHRYADLGEDMLATLGAGRCAQRGYPSAGNDVSIVRRASAGQLDLTSTLHVPVLRAGILQALLAVHFEPPHVFDDDERDLVEETAKRLWTAITHARAERALRATTVQLSAINEGLEARVAGILAQREAAMLQLHEVRKMDMVGQLTGGIAHDFNNMLTPIIASLELIRRRQADERSTKLIDGALLSADRARVLVGRLLSFARRQTLKPQPVALGALVSGMQELMTRSIGPTIEVVTHIGTDLPAVVVDAHQLELAILNLVVNARDAMEDGGRLVLRAGEERRRDGRQGQLGGGRYVWLQVSDSGDGMNEEVLKRCMEPFYSTKTVGKGTGLGLPMVQGLALQSGGGFSIKSRPGKGTEATIWLPVSEMAAAIADGPATEPPAAPGLTQVLLVDDEDIVRHTTGLQLRDLGYEVTEAASAAQALELIEAGLRPDALVSDHIMASKTGVQFAQELRERFPELPVLIITGYANLTPRELRGFEVLRKPFRRAELADSLAHLLARRA